MVQSFAFPKHIVAHTMGNRPSTSEIEAPAVACQRLVAYLSLIGRYAPAVCRRLDASRDFKRRARRTTNEIKICPPLRKLETSERDSKFKIQFVN